MTVYAGSAVASLQAVEVAPHGTATRTAITFVQDGAHPNRLLVTAPANLAAGTYDLYATDLGGCEATLQSAFSVSSSAALTLSSIAPSLGWTGADTQVTLLASGGLTSTPRAYLRPVGGGAATELRGAVLSDSSTLKAVVPAGLAPGAYDVVAVDPDGSFGVLSAAFQVVSYAMQITSATPSTFAANTFPSVTLSGSNFDASASATLSCVDATGTQLSDRQIVPSSVSALGDSLVLDMPALAAGDVCRVTVVNADGVSADFSPLVVTSSGAPLEPFQSSSSAPAAVQDLGTPRRALSLLSGEAAGQAFLYAIGGDDGTSAGALSSVESASVDAYGRLGAWAPLSQGALDAPRTLAQGKRVGQYLYVAGGTDGGVVLDTIIRARILDPSQAPQPTDVDLSVGATPGVPAGDWVYRVAAVLPNDGEALPSQAINVTVPDLSSLAESVAVTLTWTAVPNATRYKVYRTAAANTPDAQVAYLADASSSSFTDTGAGAPVQGTAPMAVGALGSWYAVGTLTTPRMGAAVAAAHGTTANDWFLYVGGGSDGAQVLDSYDRMAITIDPTDGSQTVTPVVAGAKTIGTARWNASAWTVDDSVTSSSQGASWVYFGTGEDQAEANTVFVTTVGQVDPATGELTSSASQTLDVLTASSTKCGTGAVALSGFLFDFGGGPTPSAGGSAAEICGPGLGCGNPSPPDLASWSSLGSGGPVIARYLNSATLQSAFIFVAGGIGGASGTEVLASVERSTR